MRTRFPFRTPDAGRVCRARASAAVYACSLCIACEDSARRRTLDLYTDLRSRDVGRSGASRAPNAPARMGGIAVARAARIVEYRLWRNTDLFGCRCDTLRLRRREAAMEPGCRSSGGITSRTAHGSAGVCRAFLTGSKSAIDARRWITRSWRNRTGDRRAANEFRISLCALAATRGRGAQCRRPIQFEPRLARTART